MPVVGRSRAQEIEPDGMFQVRRIKIRHVLDATARDVVEQVRREIAVRVYDADPMPGANVLENEIVKKCRLPRAAFADCVQVVPPVARGQNNGGFLPPAVANAQNDVPILHIYKRASTPNEMPSSAFETARASDWRHALDYESPR